MDFSSPLVLANILNEEELSTTPSVVLEKFKKYIDGFVDEYCKEKAAGSRADEVKLQNYPERMDDMDHEEFVGQKDKVIKDEIKHQLLKELQQDSVETAVLKLTPCASDMSSTELYSLYVKCTDELEILKRENSRLNLQMQELQETVPASKKLIFEYEKVIAINAKLIDLRDELLAEKSELDDKIVKAQSRINQINRYNAGLERTNADLCHQLSGVLKERLGSDRLSDIEQQSNPKSEDDVVSEKLESYFYISELQDNNHNLLILVRKLSSMLEELTECAEQMQANLYDQNAVKHFRKIQKTLDGQQNAIESILEKVELYKKQA